MTRARALTAAAVIAATLLVTGIAAADPPDQRPSHHDARSGVQTITTTPSTTPGVQVGPPLPAAPAAPGGGSATGTGKPDDPGFFDIPGQIRKAIDDWFRGLVNDALHPVMDLLGKTLLSTPQLATQPRVAQLWQVSLGIADALLVLVILAAGALVMGHETVQTRYALKDAIPRLALGAVAANVSLPLVGQMIELANSLSAGFMGGTRDLAITGGQLVALVLGAIKSGGMLLVFLGLACAVLGIMLLVLYILRTALLIVLVCAGPVMLLCHALPGADGLARLWWRSVVACLGIQVAQALVLATTVRVILTPDGRGALGVSASGGLIDLLVVLCLLWLLVKIPFWAKELAFSSGRPSVAARAAKTYVMAKIVAAAA